MAIADAAIDLARMLEVPLVVARVKLPEYLGDANPAAAEVIAGIEQRTKLYGLRAEIIELEGNPVRELLALAKPTDLFVVGRPRTTRDSFTAPDVALRIAQASTCSTLVWTFEDR